MRTRFAFAGFRHGHILDVLAGVHDRDDCEFVGACEEDPATRKQLEGEGKVRITHHSVVEMLAELECDVVAIGDVYARRGAIVIAALEAGKHVLSDKPLCTSLDEQKRIEELARERGLIVHCQLDSRCIGAFLTLRDIIHSGELGEICTVHAGGQHPLLVGKRQAWYFEPGQHGGTINDIGIHAFDLIPWLTGAAWQKTLAARCWNGKAREFPHFGDCAQIMATLENGAGVQADFSYLAPDKIGYQLPQYWTYLIHGTRGFAEAHLRASDVTLVTDDDDAPRSIPAGLPLTRGYLADFLNEIRGKPDLADLRSADCLKASRLALEAQAMADSATR
jgi:predicted dehydrogenase